MDVEHLKDLLSFQCNDQDSQALIKTVTPEEIKTVLFVMPNDKSPGPDGYNVEFYKATWEIIDREFVVAVQAFLSRVSFLKELTQRS